MSLVRRAAIGLLQRLATANRLSPPTVTDDLAREWLADAGRVYVRNYQMPRFPPVAITANLTDIRPAPVAELPLIKHVETSECDLNVKHVETLEYDLNMLSWVVVVHGKYFGDIGQQRTGPRGRPTGPTAKRPAGQLALGGVDEQVAQDFIWDTLLNVLQPPLDLNFPTQVDLPYPLYDYQRPGIEFLAKTRPGALLGDDMGLGKTIQAIVALRILMQEGTVHRSLIVCPTSVLRQWREELQKWAPLLQRIVAHGAREPRQLCWQADAHVFLTTYATLRQDISVIRDRIAEDPGFQFDVVICDEITQIKNLGSKQAQAVRALPRDRSWGLSGTPLENSEQDVVAEFHFLHPELFASIRKASPEQVRERMTPYFLRRRKQDVLSDLPALVYSEQWVPLTAEQEVSYQRARDEGVVELQDKGETVTVMNVLSLLGKLKQISNVDPSTRRSSKIDWLNEKLAELTVQESKALIFSEYRENGVDEVMKRLPNGTALSFVGDMSSAKRHAVVEQFQHDPSKKLLLLTYGAGSQGLNLQCANYVVLFDHWWNPATNQQAIGRAHRIGQQSKVTAYSLWAETEIEEHIHQILVDKQRLFGQVIDAQAAPGVKGTGLSEEELFGLFGLQPARKAREKASIERLLALDPGAFEHLVAAVWDKNGFQTQVTPLSADGGIDVIAVKGTAPNCERIAIQCKNHANHVGRPDAQRLMGAARDPSFSKALLVATSGFTAECMAFAEQNGTLSLVDGQELCDLIHACEVHLPAN